MFSAAVCCRYNLQIRVADTIIAERTHFQTFQGWSCSHFLAIACNFGVEANMKSFLVLKSILTFF